MRLRRKILFWFFLAASLGFLAVPTVVLFEAVQQFVGTKPEDPGLRDVSLKQATTTATAGSDPDVGVRPLEPRFVKFLLKAPGAKAVFLAGDFNLWKRDHLALKESKPGQWELLLPLPPGQYRYRFVVDGSDTVDPESKENVTVAGETVSVRTVR